MKIAGKLYWIILLLLVSSLLFSYKLNSLCIIALLLTWLLEGGFAAKGKQLIREPFFLLSVLLFALYPVSVLFSEDKAIAWFFVEKNLSLVILPMVLLSGKKLKEEELFAIGKVLIAGTTILMIVATLCAVRNYWFTHDSNVFFYHKLSETVGISAIVASLFCIVSVAWVFYLPAGNWKIPVVILLLLWLVLLTSKLFLVVAFLMLLLHLGKKVSRRTRIGIGCAIAALITVLISTANPVRGRFSDMGRFREYYLTAPVFNESIYFDGLSLRLVFIRFGLEIMSEQRSYWMGVGSGDAEALLRQKIKDYHMYLGDGKKDREGYLQYGYHNEFLQKWVQLGIIGLGVFLSLILYAGYLAIRYKHIFLFHLLLIFLFTFFTDTLLEQQVGLVLFLTFCCLSIAAIRAAVTNTNTPIPANNS